MGKRNKKNVLLVLLMIMLLCTGCLMGCCDWKTNDEKYVEPTAEEYARMTPEEQVKEKIKKFHSLIVNGEFDDLSLEIYCRAPSLFGGPLSPDFLVEYTEYYREKYGDSFLDKDGNLSPYYAISVNSTELSNNSKWLRLLTADKVIPTSDDGGIDATYYCIFKQNDNTILEIVLYGERIKEPRASNDEDVYLDKEIITERYVYINGIAVENDYIFAKVIMPFLYEMDAKKLHSIYN